MKDTILWLQLKPRKKPDGFCLYSSIKDVNQWVDRISKFNITDQEAHYFSLLVEVNRLDLPVKERIAFLEALHEPVMILIEHLAKKYLGSGLPLAEDKSKYVHKVNSFWSEMATAYKIIIDDLSENRFLTSFMNQKDLACALYHVLFYLTGQLYSNYTLYSACTENVWRDIHQLFHFSSKRKLSSKTIKGKVSQQQTIEALYKKILLFSLANPYHLSAHEMKQVWLLLDNYSSFADVVLDSEKVLKKDYPFIIMAYSDQAPLIHSLKKPDIHVPDINFPSVSSSIWGLATKKLIKKVSKTNKFTDISNSLLKCLLRSWSGESLRAESRSEMIEPVVVALGVSCISQFLSQIDIKPKILRLDTKKSHKLKVTSSIYSLFQAYLIDESKSGFRVKLSQHAEKPITPNIGEVIAIKHIDNGIHIGYLRWMRENPEGEVEFGIEHLSTMAEPVQLTRDSDTLSQSQHDTEKLDILDSFVFPGGEEFNFKPILFTHTFVEKFYNMRNDTLVLNHKTGSINIKLVQKVNEVLGCSLYLFEKVVDG
ncbi:MAG: hypothetical protein KZQ64_04865 [gamma proteobacterium symbiont of Bathyaustriella thionipta]|nr:hypothetical protein [gamma proteobacterium symbiont of Bathyaustriella thionipta]MCU7948485.1 hypothetical protein [gamma proteobacterium symbiont of Bathyaustriella thionipta]MCU7952709.1 hypothetical protein [gamma proteobacterium symbiont of Bathyaustriella thionipta]MCU7955485.1 hypothetical protein [gamma proteobacterium symbiont of Bathyaustriella thionipta]MCU7966352.1 hypothetical protein [gamma proteobacterium symbiont of Bathyaustriella thionipta]